MCFIRSFRDMSAISFSLSLLSFSLSRFLSPLPPFFCIYVHVSV